MELSARCSVHWNFSGYMLQFCVPVLGEKSFQHKVFRSGKFSWTSMIPGFKSNGGKHLVVIKQYNLTTKSVRIGSSWPCLLI